MSTGALLPLWLLVIPLALAAVERVRTPRSVYAARPARIPAYAIETPVPNSLAAAEAGVDMVAYLKLQHDEIKVLFAQTLAAPPEGRQALFLSLRRLLATHEATEEELFHPLVEGALGEAGRAVVVARLGEERGAATSMTSIEHLALDSMQFEMSLRILQSEVVKHATHEEREEFPALVEFKSDQLGRVREVAQALYRSGEASAEGEIKDSAIGLPFLAMLTRARHILAGKTSVESDRTATQTAAG